MMIVLTAQHIHMHRRTQRGRKRGEEMRDVLARDIAELFALTKGRVSQLHKRALDAIRDALRMRRVAEFY